MAFTPASPLLNKTIEEGAAAVTFACVSSLTGEEGGLQITGKTTIDDVLTAYSQQFPRECAAMLLKIRSKNDTLHHSSGMSAGGRMMSVTAIPEFVLWAMRCLSRDYWTRERIYSFIRRFPKFMIGDHRQKSTKGVITK